VVNILQPSPIPATPQEFITSNIHLTDLPIIAEVVHLDLNGNIL
jgi:hypothetical protein